MAKPSPNNAFTMTETLMVLLLVGLLSTIVLPRYDATELAARQIKALCLQAQMHAYASKETITVEIGVDSARFGDTRYDFPEKWRARRWRFPTTATAIFRKGVRRHALVREASGASCSSWEWDAFGSNEWGAASGRAAGAAHFVHLLRLAQPGHAGL